MIEEAHTAILRADPKGGSANESRWSQRASLTVMVFSYSKQPIPKSVRPTATI